MDEHLVHVVVIDASCSCGEELKGAWSPEEIEDWMVKHSPVLAEADVVTLADFLDE